MKGMKKTTKDHLITFGLVIAVYIIVQLLITTGQDRKSVV